MQSSGFKSVTLMAALGGDNTGIKWIYSVVKATNQFTFTKFLKAFVRIYTEQYRKPISKLALYIDNHPAH